MSNVYLMNQKVLIIKLDCKMNLEIQYYSLQIGIIKGIKKIRNNFTIYLIEFLNHNRIWAMEHELKSCNNCYQSMF